jgi:hypothetical protein
MEGTESADKGPAEPSDKGSDHLVDEPRLKYNRLSADVTDLLATDEATSLAVSDKMLALGTESGSVCLLDYSGNEACHPSCGGVCRLQLAPIALAK